MVRKLRVAVVLLVAALLLPITAAAQQAPVRVGGDEGLPRKIKDVKPVYPQIAMAARVAGVVIIDVTIGPDGRVTDAKVLRSQPLLNQAALDAVRQWVFEPVLLNGAPTSVVKTVTVDFQLPASFVNLLERAKQLYAEGRLDDAERELVQARTLLAQERTVVASPPPVPSDAPIRIGGDIKEPRKLRDVRPAYPPDAYAARVQGVVILEAVIAPDGTVRDARVLRSVPLLDQAAVDAVRQWEFTPTYLNGVAVPVIMTVTVNFTLQ